MLDDPLVKALVAPAQQGQGRLGRKLLHVALVEHPSLGRKRDHASVLAHLGRVDPVMSSQGGVHHVDAQHHSGAAAERRVIDLSAAQGRVLAKVHVAQPRAAVERVAHVALSPEPLKPLGEQREDVDLHQSSPRKPCPRRCAFASDLRDGPRRAPSARAAHPPRSPPTCAGRRLLTRRAALPTPRTREAPPAR